MKLSGQKKRPFIHPTSLFGAVSFTELIHSSLVTAWSGWKSAYSLIRFVARNLLENIGGKYKKKILNCFRRI